MTYIGRSVIQHRVKLDSSRRRSKDALYFAFFIVAPLVVTAVLVVTRGLPVEYLGKGYETSWNFIRASTTILGLAVVVLAFFERRGPERHSDKTKSSWNRILTPRGTVTIMLGLAIIFLGAQVCGFIVGPIETEADLRFAQFLFAGAVVYVTVSSLLMVYELLFRPTT